MNLSFAGTTARRLTDAQADQAVLQGNFTIDVQQSALDTESVAFIMDGTLPINNLLERTMTGGVCRMFLNLWPVSSQVTSPWYAHPDEILPSDLIALSAAYFRRWGPSQAEGWYTRNGQPR